MLQDILMDNFYRLLSGDSTEEGDSHEFGFHIEFLDLYMTIVYFTCIYVLGQFASRVLKMPSLVGEMYV